MTEEQVMLDANPVQENVLAVLAAGLAAMLAGAVLWALVTAITHLELGLMAIVVGFLVGFGIQKVRRRPNRNFGILGAVLALAGCLLGNAFSFVAIAAQQSGSPFVDTVLNVSATGLLSVMGDNFEAMDLLFYAIAIYEGFKFASR
jgi:FtsH-binding integral membrane protein